MRPVQDRAGKPTMRPPSEETGRTPEDSPYSQINCLFEDFPIETGEAYFDDYVEIVSNLQGSIPSSPYLYFVDVLVNNSSIRALVDSGASGSFITPETSSWLRDLKVPIRKTKGSEVISATGESHKIYDTAFIPLTWNGRTAELKAKVLSSLTFPLVLGLDALFLFGTVINHRAASYFFITDPTTDYKFEIVPLSLKRNESCNQLGEQGLSELTDEQKTTLREFILQEVPPLPPKLPCTNVAEHRIEVKEGARPFKTRAIPSPKL